MAHESSRDLRHKPRTLRLDVKLVSHLREIVARTKEAFIDVGTFGLFSILIVSMSIMDLRTPQDSDVEQFDVYGDLGY